MKAETVLALDAALRDAVAEIRDVFNEHGVAQLELSIEVSGRVTGDLKFTYGLSDSKYSTHVTSHNIRSALLELMRRNSWKKTNQPLQISYTGEATYGGEEE